MQLSNRMAHALLCCLLALALPAGAKDLSADEARALQQAGEILPLEDILAIAQRHRPGKLIDVELERKKKRYRYELELLDAHGQVWELKLDGQSGELIELERED
jgi:uncharacterized membrane protein YkoI